MGLEWVVLKSLSRADLISFSVFSAGVLTSLDVGSNGLTEEAALGIVRVERQRNKLTSLGLGRCSIGPTGAAEIAEYVSGSAVLTNLVLKSNLIGDEGAAALASALRVNGVLTKLDISGLGNKVGDEGMGVIREAVSGRVGFELVQGAKLL